MKKNQNLPQASPLLRHFFLWNELSEEQWQELNRHILPLDVSTEEVIFPRAETVGCLCLLWSGRARVYTVTPPGITSDALIRTMEAGALFGVHAVFSNGIPPQSRIVAVRPSRVYLIPSDVWERILIQNPHTLATYIQFLTGRIQFLNQKIRYLSADSSEERLALYLLTEITENEVPTRLKHSAVTLADLLNISRASLYRAMRRLTDDGFLTRNGHEYCLHHREALIENYRQTAISSPDKKQQP